MKNTYVIVENKILLNSLRSFEMSIDELFKGLGKIYKVNDHWHLSINTTPDMKITHVVFIIDPNVIYKSILNNSKHDHPSKGFKERAEIKAQKVVKQTINKLEKKYGKIYISDEPIAPAYVSEDRKSSKVFDILKNIKLNKHKKLVEANKNIKDIKEIVAGMLEWLIVVNKNKSIRLDVDKIDWNFKINIEDLEKIASKILMSKKQFTDIDWHLYTSDIRKLKINDANLKRELKKIESIEKFIKGMWTVHEKIKVDINNDNLSIKRGKHKIDLVFINSL